MSFNNSKQYSLSELYIISSGLSKSRKDFGFGYPFISFKDVFYNYFLPEKIENLANTTEKERNKCSIKYGDVFLTRTSETQEELGMSSIALKDYPNATFNGFTKRLRLKEKYWNDVNPIYVAYYLRSKYIRNQINGLSIMTTRASLNNSMIEKLIIELPEMEVQNAIAKILKKIDDKIVVNKKINKTLENMAQAIFKQWFVDFEFPNEDGEPYKSSGGQMIESELGMIPEGWEVLALHDVIKISSGKRPKKRLSVMSEEFVYPLIGASSVMGYTTEHNFDEPILVIGRVGTHGIVQKFNQKVWASDNTLVIRTVHYEYVSQILNQIDYKALNRGSTQPLITQTDIKNTRIVLPSSKILNEYEMLISKNYRLISNNLCQNSQLENLRDTLLPKLMSGEIRVPLDNN